MSFQQGPGGGKGGNYPPNVTQEAGLGSISEDQHLAFVEPFTRKRPHSEHGQMIKNQRQEKGYGSIADRDGSEGEDSETGKVAVPRYPQHNSPARQLFECPFYKYDPVRYESCQKFYISSIVYVTQHIGRLHVLRDDVPESRPTIAPDKICVYCTWCRHEFRGHGAERRLHNHTTSCPARNQPATIEQTGVLLPKEYDELKSEVRSVFGNAAKWDVIWLKCFPSTAIPAPQSGNIASQSKTQQILQHLLASSAANPWSSAEIKQAGINKALGAIYKDLPLTEIEPQVNAASTIFSSKLSHHSHYGESTFDTPDDVSYSVPEPCVDPHEIDQWASPLKIAIFDVDYDKVHTILKTSFEKVAIGEYAWLLELKLIGLSMEDIADELLERSQHGPWIYSEFIMPDIEGYRRGFHLPRCLHSRKEGETMSTVSLQPCQDPMSLESPLDSLESLEVDCEKSDRETVEYLCGIGGVSPMPDGSPNLQFGSVLFENARSTAIVSLLNNKQDQVVPDVLQHLEKAIGILQQVGGCCDSFTFLTRQESFVELERLDPSGASRLGPLISLANSEASLKRLSPQLVDSLTAQLLSLAFSLYAQGHCEPFRPFFLDTPLKHVLLIGNQTWGSSFTGPCILATPVDLSCMGEMVQRRVFAFQYFDRFERSNVFSHCERKFHLKAYPEDLLDTWGPGSFIMPKNDSENLHAISIGGGLITPAWTETENDHLSFLHWSPASEDSRKFTLTFPRNRKVVIGSRVLINQACKMAPQDQVRKAIPWLKELGTFPSYWEVSERQLGLGLQAGQSAVGILNFAQTWVKRLGQTKKSNILAKRSLSIADLEGPFAVQVSFCTGIARRVRLRELLADILPAYVADLATKPCLWEMLQGCDILEILRHENFRAHYQQLDHELQAEFENLAIAILCLLQDTGVDRKGENFVVGCIPSGLAAQCFKIPIERESFWARILADSEDVATFAYVATRCFETDLRRCQGPKEPWVNTTALLSTAVSLCQDRMEGIVAQKQTSWTLKDSEAYLIGRDDAPLLVRVIRPDVQNEPELLVSMSTIIAPFLRPWSRKQGYKTPWRLRESRAIDHQHQMAESVVVTTDFENSW
ncbi:ankyrin protein 3 [Fusarium globosum]|uniref:Ankyrin protein 3 n=1 Tax=Fusarium globosum TaxID=78864 RepID=A0A8H6D2P8_9HYPO|nr:ankyrin protein 3 [Fusarium globosum]